MSIEICIINPLSSAISNEKIKNCALKVISKDCSLLVNKKNSQEDYFDLHSETINISNGYIEPPKTYGLGIKFDENLTKEFPYKEKINTMILTDKEDIGLK